MTNTEFTRLYFKEYKKVFDLKSFGMNKNTEIIYDGHNGYLAGSPEEWKEKLIHLLEDRDLRIRLGQEGRKTIEERYSVNATKEKYFRLFSTIPWN